MEADALAKRARRLTRRPLWEPEPHDAVDLSREGVERILPHRDPFLLVDHVSAFDFARGLVRTSHTIDPSDPVLAGHFPGSPVYPGVLIIEALGQTAICILGLRAQRTPEGAPLDVRVTRVHHAVFLSAVLPGDHLVMTAELLEEDTLTALVAAQAMRGAQICAACVMEVYLA